MYIHTARFTLQSLSIETIPIQINISRKRERVRLINKASIERAKINYLIAIELRTALIHNDRKRSASCMNALQIDEEH